MRESIIIPGVLTHRIDLFKALDAAYDPLDTIKKSNVNAGTEIQFVQDRIRKIEADLEDTQVEAEQIINLMQDNVILWTIARLRFLQGYTGKYSDEYNKHGRATRRVNDNLYPYNKGTCLMDNLILLKRNKQSYDLIKPFYSAKRVIFL